ncbi:MAG: hypothetical protein IJU95_08770, partial [Treponema sp.]|nr:hypothetical protein [Treponema sp.]
MCIEYRTCAFCTSFKPVGVAMHWAAHPLFPRPTSFVNTPPATAIPLFPAALSILPAAGDEPDPLVYAGQS